jgi:hypothetical protein
MRLHVAERPTLYVSTLYTYVALRITVINIIIIVHFILHYSAIQAMAKICLNLYDTMQITITVTEIQVPPVFNPIQAVVNINEENVIHNHFSRFRF